MRQKNLLERCLIAFLLYSVSIVYAENWPCFRGPSHQGISGESNVPLKWSVDDNVVWQTPIPGAGWSSPIVYGDRVFVSTATSQGTSLHLLCLDRRTGKVLWDREVHQQVAGPKRELNSYASSTPVTDGQAIYVLAIDGTLSAVSMQGKVRWSKQDYQFFSVHGLAVSPLLHEGRLIVAFDGSSRDSENVGWRTPWDKAALLAFDAQTGDLLWRGHRGLSRLGHVTPQVTVVNGKQQVITAAGDVAQGFDFQTGERLWTVKSSGEGVSPSIVVGDGLFYTGTSYGGHPEILAIRPGGHGDVTDTHVAWRTDKDVPRIPSSLYRKPHLYALTEAGVLTCFQATTGKVLWRERLRGRFSASPAWACDRLYCLSEKGTTYVLSVEPGFKILAENELSGKCCASPAFSQGHIFIRTEDTLYCLGNGSD